MVKNERKRITVKELKRLLNMFYKRPDDEDEIAEYLIKDEHDGMFKLNLNNYEFISVDFGRLGRKVLDQIDFSHSFFKDCTFDGLEIICCNFKRCIFVSTEFMQASISVFTNFEESSFKQCLFDRCTMFSVTMHRVKIKSSIFNSSIMSAVLMHNSYLENVVFSGCMIKSDFYNSKIVTTNDHDTYINNYFDEHIRSTIPSVFRASIFTKCTIADKRIIDNIPMACPSEGEFIAWKSCICETSENGYEIVLVRLLIPEDARRSSANNIKCRCDKAKVLGIYDLAGDEYPLKSIVSQRIIVDDGTATQPMQFTEYTVGKMVYADGFDDNRWNECSNGIHFYMDRKDAKNHYGEDEGTRSRAMRSYMMVKRGVHYGM